MQISQFLRRAEGGIISHYCPACRQMHGFFVDKPNPENGAHWRWDGNIVAPTFLPSMNITAKDDGEIFYCCHYRLENGQLEYLKDCTHALAGIKMALPPLPEFLRDR